MNAHMRLLVRAAGDTDDPGNEVFNAVDVPTIPREFEVVQYAGNKYKVLEGGVLWNLTDQGIFVTVVAEVMETE